MWCDGMGLNFGTGVRCGAQMWGYAVGSGYSAFEFGKIWGLIWQNVSQD